MTNWIDDLVIEYNDVETPTSWIWWSLCCVISACAADYRLRSLKGNVFWKANLYVMLLGNSGVGKDFPVKQAINWIREIDCTRVIMGRSSIQAIVTELATARTSPNGKPPLTDSRGVIINGELSSAVIADEDSLSILTDLYDNHKEWTNSLKKDGGTKEKLKEPYITALFGSSPAHFYDSIPQANIEGGYIGRNLIIYEEKRSKDIDLFTDDDSSEATDKFKDYLLPKYLPHLQKITSNKGQIILSSSARELFNKWRVEWRANSVPDTSGFFNRVPGHVVKVMMCIALSRYNFIGIIDESDVKTAIEKVTSLVYANKKAVESSNIENPFVVQSRIVLDFLISEPGHELSRHQLLTKGYGKYNAFEFDAVMENLLELGWISREKLIAGKKTDWIIKLAGEPLNNYNKYIESRR